MVLLGFGKTRTFEIFKTLVSDFKDVQVVAISGKNPKMLTLFNEAVVDLHAKSRVKVIEFSRQVPELMSISDLVVTKPGGLTASEALASGLPVLVINPIPGQEEQNAEFLEKSGSGIWLKKEDDIAKVLRQCDL